MADKASIVAGRGHVVLGVDTSALERGLKSAQAKIQSFSTRVGQIGVAMMATGTAMAGMLTPGVMAFAKYEQSLADLRAAANPTAEQFERIKAQVQSVSKATGIDPNEVAQGYNQLLFAGIPLEQVLGGVGEAAIRFARVGLMPMGEAAIIVADALNVFAREGITAVRATDLITQAASSSSISIAQVAESFQTGGASLAQFNQTCLDTTTLIGLLGKLGVKGALAGTGLKTIFTRMATGGASEAGESGDEAAKAMAELGLVVRDSSGQMLPAVEIITRLQASLAQFSIPDRDRLIKGLAGMRGVLALYPLLQAGADGFRQFQGEMLGSLTVSQRFEIMQDTLLVAMKKLWVHVQFVAIAVGESLRPALRQLMDIALPVLEWIQRFVEQNQELVQLFALDAAKAMALGAVLGGIASAGMGLSFVFAGLATVIGIITGAVALAFSPFALKLLAIAAAAYAVWYIVRQWPDLFANIWASIASSAVIQQIAKVATGFMVVNAVLLTVIGYVVYLGAKWAAIAWWGGIGLWASKIMQFLDIWFIGIGRIANQFEQMARVGEYFYGVMSVAMGKTIDGFSDMFTSIVAIGGAAWAGILDAFAVGDLSLVWDIVQVTAESMWNELSFFVTSTFYVWKDSFEDVFNSVWAALKTGFVVTWGYIKAQFYMMLADVVAQLRSVAEFSALLATGTVYGAAIRAALAATPTANDFRALAANAANEGNNLAARQLAAAGIGAGMEQVARDMRDEALREGRDADAERLNAELWELQRDAWERRWAQEELDDAFGGAMAGRQPGQQGGEDGGVAGSSIGTFGSAATAAMQLGGSSNPLQLIADRVAEQLRLHHEAHEQRRNLERQMQRLNDEFVRLPGLVVV